MKRVVATVFEPASEHGQKGMDELHEQTVNLLSFQQLPKKVFDTQVAFNMVARYGEQSVPALASDRAPRAQALPADRREGCASAVAADAASAHLSWIRFHPARRDGKAGGDRGHFEGAGRRARERHRFRGRISQQRERGRTGRCPGLDPARHESAPTGCGCGPSADNLRIAATTAVECAENMAATRPKGKIQ